MNWKRLAAIAATGALSVYTIITLQGPHGIGALRIKLAKIQELHRTQADLKTDLQKRQKRVDSLERGHDIETEMHRYGRTLPGEVEYKVTEPKVEDPDDEKAP